jgi:hypothetical protein
MCYNIFSYLYLYRNQLKKELDRLSSHCELNFCFPTLEETATVEAEHHRKIDYLLPERRLALCLYFIERNFHFTGDGIWADSVDSGVASASDT